MGTPQDTDQGIGRGAAHDAEHDPTGRAGGDDRTGRSGACPPSGQLRTIGLDELAAIVARERPAADLYVRWSRGPRADGVTGVEGTATSRDSLTGVELPGLSANSLRVEPWWGDRSLRVWVARRLYDYRHLRELRGPGVRPWVLSGEQCGRGPDNEPLVICHRAIGWVSEEALRQCEDIIQEQESDEWGPLRRAD
ncbi:MAG TPA: DUF6098 family protein [Pilimelia sp.]|nr:DUF6098 family protein [Pilimelia sp.]